jgi:hypothetical protein
MLRWLGSLLALSLSGCGDDDVSPSPSPDAGRDSAVPMRDAGQDGGEPDGSAFDASFDANYAIETVALAPLAGPHQRRTAGQEDLAFYGTDLGYTAHHGGALHIVFGDTHASEIRDYPPNDDAFGTLAFDMCPAGDEVDRFVAQSAAQDAPWWEHAGPELTFATSEPDVLARVHLEQDGRQLSLSALQTPISVISDGADRLIAMFQRSEPAACSADDRGDCPDDLECDTGLGSCSGSIYPVACVLGAASGEEGACPGERTCRESGGYCRDPNTSIDDGSATGRVLSVAHRLRVGVEAEPGSAAFVATPWVTNKLMNSFSRAVRDFDEARPHGVGNDYRTPTGEQLERSRILVWGRPSYVGSKANDRQAQLYLAMGELPELDDDGAPRWRARYFAGLDEEGAPRFVPEQRDAVPLDLSGGDADPSEPHDLINQMAVSWVEPLQRFMMLYGGDLDPGAADSYNAGWQRNEGGAIFVRFAAQPWGPWSAPEPLFSAGDPQDPDAASQYGPGGVLYHPDCEGDACVPPTASTLYPDGFVQYGWLYGPNVIECWTTARDGGADIYWNVSTWNPYEVVLMKTRVR